MMRNSCWLLISLAGAGGNYQLIELVVEKGSTPYEQVAVRISP